ncbi:MAG: CRISPR-associated helicase Cas3', partial [Firmicutes bacterium]|nr:CRISPR-associated helicase Cas3' [Bacillota bacterium]
MLRTGSAEACIFWGKFRPEDSRCLPLVAHCLDVAVVFRALCELDGIRRSLQCAAGAPVTGQQMDRLAVLAMLHDIGKANLGFQLKVYGSKMPRAGHIRELAPLRDPYALDEQLHMAFLEALPPGMHTWFDDDQVAYSYFVAAFSHHGTPLQFKGERSAAYWDARDRWWRRDGMWDPMAAIAEISKWAQIAFPGAFEPSGPTLPSEPRFHHRFAGLLMLADWLGSHPAWFPVEKVDAGRRLHHARQVAPRLLRAVGLDVSDLRQVLSRAPHHFHQRFGFAPRPLQEAIDALDPELPDARLVIAESETGSGKTEAALNWWFKLFRAGKVDGLFFALPTRVAAREIYGRVWRVMRRWFPDSSTRPVTLLAVPGYVQVDGLSPEQTLPAEESANIWQDDEVLLKQQRQWAGERPKRFLAATVAVGTIDQALLSAVQTAHAHLRSVCLDRSLLVVDEVHASDVYMSRLLERLLEHHLRVGGYAMLLSATLGARARYRYVSIAGNQPPLAEARVTEQAPCPAITLADGVPRAVQVTSRGEKRVRFELMPVAFTPEAVVEGVAEALAGRARIVVVMNTVDRANALLRAFERCDRVDPAWLFTCAGVVCPHHGRFAPEDRSLLDGRVSELLGPGSAGGPLLLVGTQTLEQSLDIDADLMISDLAPADVLLQRVGRLHRHNKERPPGYGPPARSRGLVPGGGRPAARDAHGR